MRYESGDPEYQAKNAGKCWEMFHPELTYREGRICDEDLGHDGRHKGRAFEWEHEPQVDSEVARRFLALWERIPNYPKDVVLNDDGTVTLSMSAFYSATAFIDIAPNPYD